VKVYKKDSDDNVVEEMLITSALNLQLEKLVGVLQPRKFPLTKTKTHEELECLGFELTDLSLSSKKGYFELIQRYSHSTVLPESNICIDFRDSLTKGREKFKEKANELKSSIE